MQPTSMLPPSPVAIFDLLTAYQHSGALKAAIELDVFSAIGAGQRSAAAIAERCAASERGVRILCDYLTTLRLLEKSEGEYSLSATAAAFLDRGSVAYLGDIAGFLTSPLLTLAFADVAAAVRKGGTAVEGTLSPDHPIWVEFARSMAPIARFTAEAVAQVLDAAGAAPSKLLDVAAGHGLFGITLALHDPNAEVVAVDWANVLAVAEENARAAGISDRFSMLPGSVFEVDFGTDYDLILLPNFLHHFDPATCEEILRKVRRALKPSGRAVTVEFIPDENRTAPPQSAMFALVMLATTPAGDTYTFSEYDAMFRRAGFSRNELRDIPMSPQRLIVSYGEQD